MKMVVSALLVGASLFASGPASAADYFVYSFSGTGTEKVSTDLLKPTVTNTGYFSAELYVLANATLPYSYYGASGARGTLTSTDAGVTFSETKSLSSVSRFSYTATAFLPVEGSFAVGVGGGDANGTFAYTFDSSTSLGTSEHRNVQATITNYSISRFSGFAYEGFQNISAVPEPATWLTMVLGFGAIGAMARRRQAVSARNAASPSL